MNAPEAAARMQRRTQSEIIADLQRAILMAHGTTCGPTTRLLDLGCGNGATVRAWWRLGVDAHGCDLAFKTGLDVEPLVAEGRLALITTAPYRLPYPDASFDVVVSNQVMEHVHDYATTIAEMRRVLAPGGCCLHFFPSRFVPIEPHVRVPLATVVRYWWWLAFWAKLGVRKADQRGWNWRRVVDENHRYLRVATNYLSGAAIERALRAEFREFVEVEATFLGNSPHARGRRLSMVGEYVPLVYTLYRTFWARAVPAR